MNPSNRSNTIAAIATAPGRGGIGVVRVSGKNLSDFAKTLTGKTLLPRVATLCTFQDAEGAAIDQGIALFFTAPHSFTGEDVLECQGHGGPMVLQALLSRVLSLGAQLAAPGEFTQRAYLNGKMDLAQAESVADLIDASSIEAAKSAARSLTGEFSTRVNALVAALTNLRMHIEACIDFPEEEIDPADIAHQAAALAEIRQQLALLMLASKQGAVLRDGLQVVLIGQPNVGKSSLLNCLAGEDLAIVTPIAGTTRDSVRATIALNGVPIHLIDTAGLRETTDAVEAIGIQRTWGAVAQAGAALLICDAADNKINVEEAEILKRLPPSMPVAHIFNKTDKYAANNIPQDAHDPKAVPLREKSGSSKATPTEITNSFYLSAKTGQGVDSLRNWLLHTAGWQATGEGVFLARQRHLRALTAAGAHLSEGAERMSQFELFAEECRLAQQALAQITGEFTPDDLLGEIFSRFCIGK
jgi:tRNA modification GTPase